MEKVFHIQRIAAKIKGTESAIDEALAQAAELMIEMRAAQDGLELGTVVGDSSFAKLSQAIAELAQARTSVITTHKRLVKIYDLCGLRTIASNTIPTTIHVDDERFEDKDDLAAAG
jgi:hypothetical protein